MNIELTNMVFIEDKERGRALVIDREKKYKGLCFPGGHAEPGESIYDSAVREVKEETGLDVSSLELCGFMDWCNPETGDRSLEFFYRTDCFSGTLIERTDEGRVFWVGTERLENDEGLSPNFREYLHIFLDENVCEGYCEWTDEAGVRSDEFKYI